MRCWPASTRCAWRRRRWRSTAREELFAAQEKLVQSEKLAVAGQLAAGVGHEINNPLSFVIGNLHFALE